MPLRLRRPLLLLLATLAGAAVLAHPGRFAAALEEGSTASTEEQPPPDKRAYLQAYKELDRPPRGYARIFASVLFGDGFRFNNPYRLATQLGPSAESVSVTAPYLDLGAAVAFGPPNQLQHGTALRFSFALRGVPQTVITPSYVLVYRGPHRFLGYGRIGTPFLVSPDANMGGELAAGGAWFITAGFGLTGEISGSLFYGASIREVKYPAYPILSASLGLMVDFEILP